MAAFNPSSSSGTKLYGVLFPRDNTDPSSIFDTNDNCAHMRDRLSLLVNNYGKCALNEKDYRSLTFPSICGVGTNAVPGLNKIVQLAKASSTEEKAMVLLSSGKISDSSSSQTKELLEVLESEDVKVKIRTVSYTHLTLPTIYSV